MQFNALGYANLFGSQWLALVEMNAPALWVEVAGESDLPATPVWTADERSTKVTQPETSYQAGYTHSGEEMLVQVTYTIWFRSPEGRCYAPVDGPDMARHAGFRSRTADVREPAPLPCRPSLYPVRALTLRADGEADVAFVAQGLTPARGPVLRLEAGTHRDRRMLARTDLVAAGGRRFTLLPHDEQYSLPHSGGASRSLFGPEGFVEGSQGRDDLAEWSSGIAGPGAFRQDGHRDGPCCGNTSMIRRCSIWPSSRPRPSLRRSACRVRSFLSACCGLALALAAQAGAAPGPALGDSARVLAFGDSLTYGIGGSGENYPNRLAQLIGRPVANAGLPGETTAQGRLRLPTLLRQEQPTLLILCLGVNDLLRGVPDAEILANLVAMIHSARAAQVEVLLLATPQLRTAQAHPLYAEAAQQGGAWLEEHAMVDVLSNPALKADLVHPNLEGYRAVAEALAHRLGGRARSGS